MPRAKLLVLALVVPALPATALAQDDAAADRADDGAGTRAAEALLERPDLSAAQRNRAYEALALALLADGRVPEAEAALRTLYRRDPAHRLSHADAGADAIAAFAAAQEAATETVAVRLSHRTPTLSRREPPVVRATLVGGADAVEEVRLTYLVAGRCETRVAMARATGRAQYTAQIPVVGAVSEASDVAYRIEALAPSGAVLARAGSPLELLQLRIPAEGQAAASADVLEGRPPPSRGGSPGEVPEDGDGGVVSSPTFWVLLVLGVGAVAGGVAAGVAAANARPPEGTLGTVTLMTTAF
jgi:hypothetical protein